MDKYEHLFKEHEHYLGNQFPEMAERIATAPGFIAALDQSGGSTPAALQAYGIDSQHINPQNMFSLIHQMRERVISNAAFSGDHILGAILFEDTVTRTIENQPTAKYLWQEKGIVPFLKVDAGLEAEQDGVQLMKPIDDLQRKLNVAVKHGVFGTKMRSVINTADTDSIDRIVAQQIYVAKQIMATGLTPIIEPEVNIRLDKTTRAQAEQYLAEALEFALDRLGNQQVILKLSIPVSPSVYNNLVYHPNVLRVVALSGGFEQEKACELLYQCPGIIASFSRALLEGLHVHLSRDEFESTLRTSVLNIYRVSTTKG
jgi:fructose-bisphosphate aldolase, class I